MLTNRSVSGRSLAIVSCENVCQIFTPMGDAKAENHGKHAGASGN